MTARPGARTAEGPIIDGPVIDGPVVHGQSQPGDEFAGLDSGLPLLLLPVAVETRYVMTADPAELRIRVYPDQIHIDSGTALANTTEEAATIEFWRSWHAQPDARSRTWQAFEAQVGRARAGHLARMLRPRTNQRGELVFPAVTGTQPRPARAALLPTRWLAVAYAADGRVLFQRYSRPVVPELQLGPDPRAAAIRLPDSDLATDEGMAWMVDYDKALAAGMAITVALTGAAAAATQIATLCVVGLVNAPPVDAAQQLVDLLAVHARTDGFAFVPQGTATNNTALASAGTVPTEVSGPPPPIGVGLPDIDRPDLDLPGLEQPGLEQPGVDRPGLKRPGMEQARRRPAEPAAAVRAVATGATMPDPATADPAGTALEPVPLDLGANAERLAFALGLPENQTLARAPYGTDAERSRSRAMLTLLYQTIYGRFTDRLLQVGDSDGMTASARSTMRDWCLDHVTGGAAYPTVQIGPQPYGILPVCRSTEVTEPGGTADRVRQVIALLIDEWRTATAALPRMDPNRTDTLGGTDPAADVTAVLATAPHPARLFTRRLDEYAELNAFARLVTPQFWYSEIVLGGLDLTRPDIVSPYREIAAVYGLLANDRTMDTIDAQIQTWTDVSAVLPNYLNGTLERDGLAYVDSVLSVLHAYESRQRPARWLDLHDYAGALGAENTALIEGLLYATAAEWPAEALVQAPDAPVGQTTVDYLTDLRDRLSAGDSTVPPSTLDEDFLASQPLLYQLVDRTLPLVNADRVEKARYLDALDTLIATPAPQLAWLMRESLGLATHRLDAWATSLAAHRLQVLRANRPVGVQVGAFGWVADLRVRGSAPSSDGYIHTPSMAHAATAALLRTGWLVHGNDDPLSPVAVNASSARIRAASWLLDGVRAGSDLGDLLGYRFERDLHDRGADVAISDIRRQVLKATGRPDALPDRPVDGIDLLEQYRAGAVTSSSNAVAQALEALDSVFDAANDVGLVEAVHQLAAGNFDRAGAMLDSLTGVTEPPELRAPRTPTAGVSVEHRVLLLLDPQAPAPGRGWVTGIRDRVAPALEAWLAGQLPPATSVGFRVIGTGTALSLGELGLSAMDACYLVGFDPDAVAPAITTLTAGRTGAEAVIDPADRAGHAVSLREFAVLARELRDAIEPLRVADARDLRPAHTPGTPDGDDSSAVAAANGVIDQFTALVNGLTAADPAPAVAQLARFGIATGAGPWDVTGVAELAQQRLDAMLAMDEEAGPGPRLAALIRATIPLLPIFVPSEGAVDFGAATATAAQVSHWLDDVGMVRPRVGRLTTAAMVSAMLGGAGLSPAAGQLPLVDGEPWVAIAAPAAGIGPRGRLSVVAAGMPPRAAKPTSGLVVDAWSERTPAPQHTTGLAMHFDAPSNRPPQAWLLAVAPDGIPWSEQLVLDTVTETLEWARLRAVGPEDLQDYGRAIPTSYAPGYVVRWPSSDGEQ